MNKDAALRLSLKALKSLMIERGSIYAKAIIACEDALKVKDEPVAWMFQHEETGRTMCVDAQQLECGFEKGNPRLKKIAPLYTTPQNRTWENLTDDELSELSASGLALWDLWRAIETKLKEKNELR
jgi:hypothetical protein